MNTLREFFRWLGVILVAIKTGDKRLIWVAVRWPYMSNASIEEIQKILAETQGNDIPAWLQMYQYATPEERIEFIKIAQKLFEEQQKERDGKEFRP